MNLALCILCRIVSTVATLLAVVESAANLAAAVAVLLNGTVLKLDRVKLQVSRVIDCWLDERSIELVKNAIVILIVRLLGTKNTVIAQECQVVT